MSRDELDRYYTRPELADAIVSRINLPRKSRVLEPHAGAGAFVRALQTRGHDVIANDADPEAEGLAMASSHSVGDFLEMQRPMGRLDAIVGNPPYRAAQRHCLHALSMAPRVVFLLRLGILSSRARQHFWSVHQPARVIVIGERPSFMADGSTDHSDYCVVEWHQTPMRTPPLIEWLYWRGK